jgi:glycolate oxidase FAD binding subunit
MTADLAAFAREVGEDGPVCVAGGRTQWRDGGASLEGTREVRAPSGVRQFEPAEMTVRVGAGTPVSELEAVLAAAGQSVALPIRPGSTVGGALAVGRSGIRRLGDGPVRDTLLEARVVGAHGRPVRAGGPTVKNVSGYDLCRLFVGSLGTLALIGEVVLRTRPRPEASVWLSGEADPFAVLAGLHRPTSVLWDGARTWALVEGVGPAVVEQRRTAARLGLTDEVEGPPARPPHRRSLAPSTLRAPEPGWGSFVAEVGVGMVHTSIPQHSTVHDPAVVDLNRRLKERFDPSGRLNPGRSPLSTTQPVPR